MRAEQDQLRDGTGATAVALLIHGDAAFAGLGIVAECLQLSNLPGTNMPCSWTCNCNLLFSDTWGICHLPLDVTPGQSRFRTSMRSILLDKVCIQSLASGMSRSDVRFLWLTMSILLGPRHAGYSTGGSLHVVINNQMGFTTPPSEGRSSPHPTSMVSPQTWSAKSQSEGGSHVAHMLTLC